MTRKKQLILRVLAYTLYGLVVFLVLLYVMFPYDVLRQRLVERFPSADLRLAIGSLGPDFPPGMQLRQVRLLPTSPTAAQPVAHLETLRVRPDFLALLSRTLNFRFNARLYNGQLEGNVHTAEANAASAWELQAQFSDLQVEQYPLVRKENQAFLRGRLNGELEATLNSDGVLQQGVLKLRLQPLAFVGNEGLQLPLQREIACESLQGQVQLQAGQWQIDSFNCRGDDLSLQVRGQVQWQQPVGNSLLELNIQIRSETTFKQEIDLIGTLVRRRPDRRGILSFSIRGPLQQLRFGA